jgi:NCS1 family nucleobase:cation symporter-1
MPVGVIVFVEHWIFPKIGFTRYWAARKKLALNWPALASWVIAIAFALFFERTGRLHLFFLFIPTWFLTAALYISLSAVAGAREQLPEFVEPHLSVKTARSETMPAATKSLNIVMWAWGFIAVSTLVICIILSIWVYISSPEAYGQNFATFKNVLIWPSLGYFVSATAWAVKHEK